MAGRPWQPSTSINQLTSPPDPLLSKCRRSRHTKFQHNSRRCPAVLCTPDKFVVRTEISEYGLFLSGNHFVAPFHSRASAAAPITMYKRRSPEVLTWIKTLHEKILVLEYSRPLLRPGGTGRAMR